MEKVQTLIRLPEDLKRQGEYLAQKQGKALSVLISDLLREAVEKAGLSKMAVSEIPVAPKESRGIHRPKPEAEPNFSDYDIIG